MSYICQLQNFFEQSILDFFSTKGTNNLGYYLETIIYNFFQEILRVHARAARALANQSVPYSVCTILKDEEIYNPIPVEQSTDQDRSRDPRSRYNGRIFLSWLQDVDDKWEKIKVRKFFFQQNKLLLLLVNT